MLHFVSQQAATPACSKSASSSQVQVRIFPLQLCLQLMNVSAVTVTMFHGSLEALTSFGVNGKVSAQMWRSWFLAYVCCISLISLLYKWQHGFCIHFNDVTAHHTFMYISIKPAAESTRKLRQWWERPNQQNSAWLRLANNNFDNWWRLLKHVQNHLSLTFLQLNTIATPPTARFSWEYPMQCCYGTINIGVTVVFKQSATKRNSSVRLISFFSANLFRGQKVLTAIRTKRYWLQHWTILFLLREVASCPAAPAYGRTEWCVSDSSLMPHPTHIGHFRGGADPSMQDLASRHVTVMSRHIDLTICRVMSVKPSGLSLIHIWRCRRRG